MKGIDGEDAYYNRAKDLNAIPRRVENRVHLPTCSRQVQHVVDVGCVVVDAEEDFCWEVEEVWHFACCCIVITIYGFIVWF